MKVNFRPFCLKIVNKCKIWTRIKFFLFFIKLDENRLKIFSLNLFKYRENKNRQILSVF